VSATFRASSDVAICVVFVPAVAVGAAGVPVNVGEASGALVDKFVVIVAAKFASSPNAFASSSSVSRAAGAAFITLLIAVVISACVALPANAVSIAVNFADAVVVPSSNTTIAAFVFGYKLSHVAPFLALI
jgi:hypothetical protein